MKKIVLAIIVVAAIIGLFIWMSKPSTSVVQGDKLVIATSIYPLQFLTSQLVGDEVNVFNLTPAGIEPHDFEPSPRDLAQIERSKLLIINGGSLEAWLSEYQVPPNTKLVNVGESLMNLKFEDEGEVVSDPHIWLSPVLAKEISKVIATSLKVADPDNSANFERRLQILEGKLDELNAKFKNGLASCKTREFITSHAAFGYLANTYKLTQIPISGISPDEEPSLKKLSEISNMAKQKGIKYIFFESLVSPKFAETIATEIGAQTLTLDPIEGISVDDMKAGKNYFTIMEENLKNLRTALSCT